MSLSDFDWVEWRLKAYCLTFLNRKLCSETLMDFSSSEKDSRPTFQKRVIQLDCLLDQFVLAIRSLVVFYD